MPKNTNRNHNRPWTTHDEKRMRRLARQKFSSKEAAINLGRSRGAVAYKAMMLGVHFRSIAQPPGVQQRLARRRRR